jgi:hypothetical protein
MVLAARASLLLVLPLAPCPQPAGAAEPGYVLAEQREWQEEFRAFVQENFRGLIEPYLNAQERQRIGNYRFVFPIEARPNAFDFQANSRGEIVLPVESLLLLKDLALAQAWLSLKGYSLSPVFEYAAVLGNGGLGQWPVARRLPKAALGLPADAGRDPAVAARYEQILLGSVLFLVGHELGHLHDGFRDWNHVDRARRRDAERRADAFAFELMKRAGLAPAAVASFFGLASRLVPLAQVSTEAAWLERMDASTHPLDGERIAAAADFIDARRADFYRAFKNPANAPQQVEQLVFELRQVARLVSDRSVATTQADCALTLQPDDLQPRRGDTFDLRPAAGERLPAGPWSGFYEGRVSVDPTGTSAPLRVLMRRDGPRLIAETQHLCFRGRAQGRVDGTVAELVWTVGGVQRTLSLSLGAGGTMQGRWKSQQNDAEQGGWTAAPLPRKTSSAPWVVPRVQRLQPLARHVGVDRGGGDVCMPEQHLHCAQVGTVVQQVRGEGMAQRVRRQRRIDTRRARMALDQLPEHLPRHRATARGDEQRVADPALEDGAARLGQVAPHPGMGLGAEGHEPLLRALAGDAQCALVQAHVHRLQCHQLADAQAAGVHQFDHRSVAQAQRRAGVGRGQQGLDLRLAERLGHAQGLARGLQLECRVGVDQALAQRPAAEALEHAQPPVGGGGARGGMALGHVGQQVRFACGLETAAVLRLQPLREQVQIAPVGSQRQRRQAILDPQGIDESIDLRRTVDHPCESHPRVASSWVRRAPTPA